MNLVEIMGSITKEKKNIASVKQWQRSRLYIHFSFTPFSWWMRFSSIDSNVLNPNYSADALSSPT